MLLVGFLFGEMEVSKQQLIDKAIDDLKGELPWGTSEASILVYYPRPSSYAMSHPICIHSGAYEICTRREFEERKVARGVVGVSEQHENERNCLAQLIDSHGNLSAGQLADSILAAGYRKCDN